MKNYFCHVLRFVFSLMVISVLIVSLTTMSFFHLSNVNAQNTTGELEKLNSQGIILASSDNYTEAMEIFNKSLTIDPNNINAIINTSDTLHNLDNFTDLLNLFNKSLVIDPNSTLKKLGHIPEAIKFYDEALKAYPDNTFSLNNKGDILFDVGNYSGAIHHYDKALSIDPNNKYALLSKAISLFVLGNYTGALKTYDKAFVPDAVNTYILKSRADTLLENGNIIAAIETYDRVLSINSSDIYTLYSKGNALSYLGKHDEANKNFDKALSLNTTDKINSNANIQNETQKKKQNLLTYRENVFGIKFDYPDTWGYKEFRYFFVTVKGIQLFPIAEISLDELKFNESKISFNEPIDSPVRFGIERDDSTPFKNMPLDQYKDFDIERLEANGWNITSVYRTTIGSNVEAYQINYEGPIEKGMDILFVKPPDAFQIYFVSYDYLRDKYLPAVEKMINSIEFLN